MSDTETCEVAPLAEDYREQVGLGRGDKVLSRIMQNSKAFPFSRPVDVEGLGLTDYFNIVKTPMDLGTVRKKLRKKLYKHPDELREDIELTFTNAMIYNPATDDVHQWYASLVYPNALIRFPFNILGRSVREATVHATYNCYHTNSCCRQIALFRTKQISCFKPQVVSTL